MKLIQCELSWWHSISRVKNLIDLVKIKSVKWSVSNSYGVGSFSCDEIVERCGWVGILWHIHLQVSMQNAWTQGMWKVATCVICQLQCSFSLFFLFKIIIICFWWRHLKISRCYAWSFKPSFFNTNRALLSLGKLILTIWAISNFVLLLQLCSNMHLFCGTTE